VAGGMHHIERHALRAHSEDHWAGSAEVQTPAPSADEGFTQPRPGRVRGELERECSSGWELSMQMAGLSWAQPSRATGSDLFPGGCWEVAGVSAEGGSVSIGFPMPHALILEAMRNRIAFDYNSSAMVFHPPAERPAD